MTRSDAFQSNLAIRPPRKSSEPKNADYLSIDILKGVPIEVQLGIDGSIIITVIIVVLQNVTWSHKGDQAVVTGTQ